MKYRSHPSIYLSLRLVAILWLPFLPGCGSLLRSGYAVPPERAERQAFVVSHGWHTGIVVRRDQVPPEVLPVVEDFRDYEYLEIGWGDEGFYTAKEVTVELAIHALFVPTPSVMHVVGFNGAVERRFPFSDIVVVGMSAEGFQGLCRYLGETLARDRDGKGIDIAPGLYGYSRFYRGNGSYYFPETCNVWTARALEAAGFPMMPLLAITAESMVGQAADVGWRVGRREEKEK